MNKIIYFPLGRFVVLTLKVDMPQDGRKDKTLEILQIKHFVRSGNLSGDPF